MTSCVDRKYLKNELKIETLDSHFFYGMHEQSLTFKI